MEINGKVALVTGGARRVGRALSLALAGAGANVVVNYNSSAADAESLVAEIEAMGRRALAVQADVGAVADVERMVERVSNVFGRLDVLVNSASTFERTPLEDVSEAEWDRVMAVNLKGPFFLSQKAAPLMRRNGGGVIVSIADLAGLDPWPNYPHHSVSKAGLVMLTRVLAVSLAPDIRSNAIAPGTVLPPDTYSAEQVYRIRERIPLRRIGSAEDVADALLYLVRSDFVTGEVLVVDGGRRLAP